jgi:hypothetical protein
MRLIDKKLSDITESEVECLIRELKMVTNVSLRHDATLWFFLWQCVYPWGTEKRYNIEKNDIIPGGLLSRKLSGLQGTSIYQICEEIAVMRGTSAELFLTTSLYVFFNKLLPDLERKPKKYRFHPRDPWRNLE